MHETQMLKGHLLVKHSSTLEIGIKLVYSRSQRYMNVEERSCLADTESHCPLPPPEACSVLANLAPYIYI